MKRRLVGPTPMIVKINVTPIIDVALVLVIILLITAPMMAVADFDVDLPATRTRSPGDETRVNVSLSRYNEFAVDGVTTLRAHLAPALRTALAEHEGHDVLVVLRADATIRHEVVRSLLDDLRDAGVVRLAIATRPETTPR
jgi:biopolymer transport protein TolR